MRPVWFSLGVLSVAIGMVGMVLPILPTVPFMILATFFFARSSPRFHRWLTEHPVFGPQIRVWREEGAISRRGKWLATASLALAFMVSVLLEIRPIYLTIQGGVMFWVLIFIWSRPHGKAGGPKA